MRVRKGLFAIMASIVLAGTVRGGPFADHPQGMGRLHQAKPTGQEQAGFWTVPVPNSKGEIEPKVEPYYPQPGDIMLYDFDSRRIAFLLKAVGSGSPMHAAIVIERPDGTPAILEVGPNSKPHAFTRTYILDVLPRLEDYPGRILIRRPRQALSKEQSAQLFQFAQAQEGKKFAVGRLMLQGTPFRCRHGLRHILFAHTHLQRSRWICSENVVAAATVAGLLDPRTFFANAMYPRDLAFDESYDLSPIYHPPVPWSRQRQ